MLGALAEGRSEIEGFLEGEDTRATAAIFARLGVCIQAPSASRRVVHGVGLHGLQAATGPLDCGNAGTGMRLLAGLLAGQAFDSTLVGDASLSRRPMGRVITPLRAMGATIEAGEGGLPPLRIHANKGLQGIDFKSPVASAQVKSAVLLAGLYARGTTRVQEPHPTRDYTERMLRAFGVEVGVEGLDDGQRVRERQPAGWSAPDRTPQAVGDLRTARRTWGAIRIWRGTTTFSPAEERLLRTFASQGALALERANLAASETRARVLEESDRLKSALLSSVSHELRTPLATIKASASSLLSGAVGFVLAVYLTVQKLVYGLEIAGRPLLLLSVLLILVSFQFITMGLLAEMLARTYHESQNKPIYVIKEVLDERRRA